MRYDIKKTGKVIVISTTKQSMGIDPSFGATVLIEGKCFLML